MDTEGKGRLIIQDTEKRTILDSDKQSNHKCDIYAYSNLSQEA